MVEEGSLGYLPPCPHGSSYQTFFSDSVLGEHFSFHHRILSLYYVVNQRFRDSVLHVEAHGYVPLQRKHSAGGLHGRISSDCRCKAVCQTLVTVSVFMMMVDKLGGIQF